MREIEFSQLGSIRLIGEETDYPMWSIIKYIDETCNNYNRIRLINGICDLLQEGRYDSEFWVAKKSAALFPKKTIEDSFYFKEESYIKLTTKSEDPEKFWHIVTNYARPMVFLRQGDEFTPIVDFVDEDAVKINSFSYNSPPIIDVSGALGTLIDLAYAGERNDREEEEHVIRQLGESAENYRKIAHASQVINSDRTPQGYKEYANRALQDILVRQEVLNKKLGIRVDRIDRRI